MTVVLPIWNSHCTRVRFTVTGYAVMSLQFNHAPSFACRGDCKSRDRIILLLVFIA